MLLRAPLVVVIPLLLSGITGCRLPTGPEPRIDARGQLLHTLGFALTDDGDASTPAGDLNATFDAPVVGVDDDLSAYGTAHVAFDDAARDLASAVVTDAVAGTDITYALLFDPDVPWRYVVVAAHQAALVDGAVLPFDNEAAAALVVDEETGSGYLADSGALTVTSASIASGGRLIAELSGSLHEVSLEEWPQNLFPFTEDGSELATVTAAGSGSFDALWSERGEASGSASFTLEMAGLGSFTADQAFAMPLDDVSTAIVLASAADSENVVVALADTAALAAGATLSFDGFSTGAWFLAADGSQVAFTEGTLTITSAELVDGGHVVGTLTIAGDGYVLPADEWSGEGEGEGEDCTGIDTLASGFAPASVYLEGGFGPGELPDGYDRMLTFADDGAGLLGLLVATDVDFASATPYSFASVDYQGRPWPAAVLGIATCSQMIEIESGTLTASLAAGRMTGELQYVVDGQARTLAIDVEAITP